VPAYNACLGTGDLKWNLHSHLAMGSLNVALGVAGGALVGGVGVIGAWSISLAVGGAILNFAYHRGNALPLRELLPEASRTLTLFCVAGTLASYLLPVSASSLRPSALSGGLITLCFLFAALVPVWTHPLRREITGWMNRARFKEA
jgi:hypothetical protein